MMAAVQRTITQVQEQDAVFRAEQAAAPPMDPRVEGATLKTLLSDAGVCDRCASVTGARWSGCQEAMRAVLAWLFIHNQSYAPQLDTVSSPTTNS